MGGAVRCHYPLGDPQREDDDRAGAGRWQRRGSAWSRRVTDRSSSRPTTSSASTHPPRLSASPPSCRPWAASRFALDAGKTLAVVGESGCGKSTLARMVALIEKPTAGRFKLDGVDAVNATAQHAQLRRTVQLVFQNPYGSLNPRKKIGDILEAPLAINMPFGKAERAPARARHAGAGGLAARVLRTAIRTCSPAASASASRSHAR